MKSRNARCRNRRVGAKAWSVIGIVVFLAAVGVTGAGGGVDDPNSDRRCIAHEQELGGCNPNAGRLFGRCVILIGEAWNESDCKVAHAIPADVTARAGDDQPRPALAGCGHTGMPAILATIRTLESGGRYDWPPNAGGASGAYQFIQGTWNTTARRAGRPDLVGVTPGRAAPVDQDQLARHLVTEALAGTDDVTRIPVVWYVGSTPPPLGWDVVPAPGAGNRYTPRQYQRAWLDILDRVSKGCDS